MAGPSFFDNLGSGMDAAGDAVRAFSPTALARRLLNNPDVMEQIGTNLPAIAKMNPALAARIQAREPEAILEAYQLLAQYGGEVPSVARQMELPMDDDMSTAMIAYGNRGRGMPVGGPTGSGTVVPGPTGLSTQVTPRTRIPGPPQRRLETTAGVPVGEVTPRSSPRSAPTPARLESPDVVAERRAMERPEDSVAADEAAARAARAEANRPGAGMERARQVAEDVVRKSAIPVAAGVGGIAAYNAMQGLDGVAPADAEEPPAPRMVPDITSQPQAYRTPRQVVPDVTSRPQAYRAPRQVVPDVTSKPKPMSTADLAAETSPPPVVEAPVQIDYAQMARDKIRQANEIQLREGRITPESAALSREADALYLRAAEERRRGNHAPIMPVEMQNEQTSAIRARQRRAG